MNRRRLTIAAFVAALACAGAGTAHGAAGAAKSGTVDLRATKLGKVLVDAKGMTLYLFEKDRRNKSACAGACAKVWSPLLVKGKPTAGGGVKASLLGTTRRKSGVQVTYNGHPLYHFSGDKKPGDARGEGSKAFGAEWYVLSAKGAKVEKGGS
ncbi:MAG: hypothetical protein E6G10_06910 [Actinobacteria bacterium]|nr:MAG: hypothetical protein E6G10_06910 [Actinomycetota bacterium]